MKKTILSIAVIAAAIFAASCQKENHQENTATEGSASVFTATIETVAGTKTTIERVTSPSVAYKTKWENTDKISINGVTYTAAPDGADATKATFTKDSGNDPTGTFNAYFPATIYSGSTAILHAKYTYAEGKYNMPMYAESDNTTLSFKNLCGVLAITVKGTDFTSVSSIEVSSDKQMNGEFTAAADGTLTFKTEGVTLTDALKRVTITFASPKTIAADGSATFYIPVPAGTHIPLIIDVSNGTKTKTMVTKKSGGVEVVRNTVYPIDFSHNYDSGVHEYVMMKMGADSSKRLRWATTNIRDSESNKDLYFSWGDTDGQTWSGTSWSRSGFYSTSYSHPGIMARLPEEKDAAYKKWGNTWRMPTSAEFKELNDACKNGTYNKTTYASTPCGATTSFEKGIYWCSDYDGKAGCLFCDGTNKVFFPTSGTGKDNGLTGNANGYYWSSTSTASGKASTMGFGSSGIAPENTNTNASDGNLVRPVSK